MPTLIQQLKSSLSLHAERTAIEGSSWLLSYRDLDRESARLAWLLREAGVEPGQVVPLFLERSPRFIIAMLAVLRCGAAYAPIDLASPPLRQAQILDQLDAPVALVERSLEVPGLERRTVVKVAQALGQDQASTIDAWPDTPLDAPLYVMFTSGSTGAPKGVVVPHRGVQRLVVGADYASFNADARWAALSSLAFDASTLEIWGPLLNGATCVVQEEALPALDALASFLVQRRISDAWLTAALFNAMVDDRVQALAGLRQLLIGGERVSCAHVRSCLAAHPNLRLINGYGPTENTTFTMCHRILASDVALMTGGGENPRGVPIGKPIRGSTAIVIDEHGADVADGFAGELLTGGEGVALGYLHEPGLTAERFITRAGARWYRTGDRVLKRRDGVYEFLGRADRQVKIQGHRVELDEVERILGSAPGVGNAAVLVRGDSAESRHLVGAYSGRDSKSNPPSGDTVRRWLEQHLPPAMTPHVLHALATMPLNLNGKVDRKALGEQLFGESAGGDDTPAVLGSETERQLARIWKRCLPGAVRSTVDARAHFTKLGGTSILALRVAAEVRSVLMREIAPLEVLRHPVLAELAKRVDAAPAVRSLSGATPQATSDELPLTRGQASMLAASALDDSACAYLVHTCLHIQAPVDLKALRKAFEAVAQRQPMLRTTARLDGLRASGRLLPKLPEGFWTEHGLLADQGGGEEWPKPLLATLNRALDVAVQPMRVDVWRLADGGALLVWTIHHFAIDEAGVDRVLEELNTSLRGQSMLPVYGSPFAFGAIEKAWTDDAGIERRAQQFAAALRGHKPPLPAPPSAGNELPLSLPGALVAGLPERAAIWGCTPFAPLVLAAGLTLQSLFGAHWRFLLTPFSRRLEPELIEPVGYLLDLRLVEAGARPDESLEQALKRVHRELIDGQQPAIRSADRVAEALDGIDPGLRGSLFQFGLTWRQQPQRDIVLGQHQARLVQAPQQGSRFGLCLHLSLVGGTVRARLEGVQAVFDSGLHERFEQQFAQCLHMVLALDHSLRVDDVAPKPAAADEAAAAADAAGAEGAAKEQFAFLNESAGSASAQERALRDQAARVWAQWVGKRPKDDNSDFLHAGGSSLRVLRMAASLRRSEGVALDIPAFLAKPSFGSLVAQLRRPVQATAGGALVPTWTLLGPRSFSRYVLLIPGWRGTALGLLPAAEALRRRLPADHAVVMADLATVIKLAPEQDIGRFVRQQLTQAVRDLGEPKLAAVAGFAAGGVIGAELLQAMGNARAAAVPLFMVDSHAPNSKKPAGRPANKGRAATGASEGFWLTRWVKGLRLWFSAGKAAVKNEGLPPLPAGVPGNDDTRLMATVRESQLAPETRFGEAAKDLLRPDAQTPLPTETPAETARWASYASEYATATLNATHVGATLVHTGGAGNSTNGFSARSFGALRVVAAIAGSDGAARASAAEQVAQTVARGLR
jgi:amino acid adenylation domain-containing protein